MNNYEKIKQMTVEEMAVYMDSFNVCNYCNIGFEECVRAGTEPCIEANKKWLLQEVEE
jgi:hypothetical protein